nr:MAG TPA: hypothetical protein [Podoviridae sp. ctfN46]
MITIPFDLELAKKINNGERNGMIVTVAGDDYETEYTPYLYDFSIIDFTDVHPDDGEAEDRVVLQMYR